MEFQDIFLDSVDSTNRVARAHGRAGAAHGSGVMADSQTGGRGRLGRVWFSPPGKNLYCSYIVRPAIRSADYPKLTMVAGVAAAACLSRCYRVAVGLKWPNDLYIGGKKCGGILSESVLDEGEAPFAVIGIGINCNLAPGEIPMPLQDIATSLYIEGGAEVAPGDLFGRLRGELLAALDLFQERGFSEILKRWRGYDAFCGRTMTWTRPDGSRLEGATLGPDEDGAMRVRDRDGAVHRVFCGDLSLASPAPERS